MSGKETGRIFAVGDIHGCHDQLRKLLARLPLDEGKDRLVFCGDYINRGPDSRRVIECLLEVRDRMPDTVFLKGNHEHALLEYARTGDLDYLRLLRVMGVEATLRSYNDAPTERLRDLSFLPESHHEFLDELQLFHRQDGYLFVHAGVKPGLSAEECQECAPESLFSVRDSFLKDPARPDEIVVFGHTAFTTPLVADGKIGIDTGAAYGNMLTAVELPAVRFYHSS